MNKTIYCEFEFLQEFINKYPDPSTDIDGLISWKLIYDLIYYANKKINVPLYKLYDEARANLQFAKLFKYSNVVYEKDFPNLENPDSISFDKEKKNSVFLTSTSKRNREYLSENYGILAIGKEDIFNYSNEYGTICRAIRKNSNKGWRNLIPPSLRISNSLIVSDLYFLSNNQKIKDNVRDILEMLLPIQSHFCYPIFIYSFDMGNNEKVLYTTITKIIRDIRPNLDFTLSLFKVYDKAFHDRHIITNNIYIECGAGFDLFKDGRALKTTNLRMAFPFMFHENQKDSYKESYLNLIADILGLEHRGHARNIDFWGDDQRDMDLISYYDEYLSK